MHHFNNHFTDISDRDSDEQEIEVLSNKKKKKKSDKREDNDTTDSEEEYQSNS